MTCSKPPKLIPAEKLNSDIHFDEPFKMVARNYCGKETVANRLEVSGNQSVEYIPGMTMVFLLTLIQDLNCCPKVPLDYARCPESIVRDAVSVFVS